MIKNMIKVLIVEDKAPILWSIKKKVQNFSPDFIITGEAFNGIEALESIKKNQPDIIITDILMPVMDGLKLIAEINNMNIQVKFIIISGHDEFEFARQAMKLGVDEYLLKPITQEALNKILDKLSIDIARQKSNTKQKLISEFLSKEVNLKEFEHNFDDYESYYVVLICSGSYSHYSLNYSHPHNFSISEEELQFLVSELIPHNVFFWPISTSKLNEMLGIFCVPKNTEFPQKEVAVLLFNELEKQAFPITIILSESIRKLEDLSKSIWSLSDSLRKKIVFGHSSIIMDDQMPSTLYKKDAVDIERNLILAFKAKDRQAFMNELSLFINTSCNLRYTQLKLERQLKKYLSLLIDLSMDLQTDDYQYDIVEIVMFNNNYPTLHENLTTYFGLFFQQQIQQYSVKPIHEVIELAATYIEEHFSEQITIIDIAEMFNLEPCYLSKSFKQLKQISPMNYLTQKRINVAKEYMAKHPSMKLKEIAEIVGYSNQYYFSRIFKSVTDQSPSVFKDNLTDL
ncbi:MAG: hypothetical protein CVV02_05365 [Firmicutes bacterium HGW-Firmicutes-7]|nr:MAG: hypothetical protein CVV02_05365 [Firmicutes bacterium HGW-Firmicutes-7]